MRLQDHAGYALVRLKWHEQAAPRSLVFRRGARSLTDRNFTASDAEPSWQTSRKAHMGRVGAMRTLVAEAVGLSFRDSHLIGGAARLHDLGLVFCCSQI